MTIRMFSPTPRGSTAGHGSLAALLVVGGVAMVLSGAQPSSPAQPLNTAMAYAAVTQIHFLNKFIASIYIFILIYRLKYKTVI